jgi:hypothetical protein
MYQLLLKIWGHTPDVEKLRDELGFPGMHVLQFGFGGDANNAIYRTTIVGILSPIPGHMTTIQR